LAHLDAGHDLDGHLDVRAAREILEQFGPSLKRIYQPRWKARLKNRLSDRFSYRWHRTRWYRENNPHLGSTSDTMLAFHLYLLLEWRHGRLESPKLGDASM
jgi:hypothetical protein